MKSKKNAAPRKIPEFSTIEEEAEFWDTHSSADYEDEFEDVDDFHIKVMRGPGYISFRVDESILDAIDKRASEAGIDPVDLIQSWIEKGLASKNKKRGPRVKAS